jgi:hypothetical protein
MFLGRHCTLSIVWLFPALLCDYNELYCLLSFDYIISIQTMHIKDTFPFLLKIFSCQSLCSETHLTWFNSLILRNLKIYHIHNKNPILNPILSQLNLVHMTTYFPMICFNIIHFYMLFLFSLSNSHLYDFPTSCFKMHFCYMHATSLHLHKLATYLDEVP